MDWNKWIIERLPRRLRMVGMFVLCVVLTSYIKQLHDEFVEWRRRLRIRMAGTPQVCQLKKIVHDELGLDIQIEEGNGKPIDFIIKTSFVDIDKERRLFALLDRYKLAGKSYGYENAEIALTAIWSRFVCERGSIQVTWSDFSCERSDNTAVWSEYVCEKIVKPLNTITAKILGYGLDLKIESTYPVETPLTIYFLRQDNKTYSFEYTGSQMVHTELPHKDHADYIVDDSVYINKTEDEMYEYELVNLKRG